MKKRGAPSVKRVMIRLLLTALAAAGLVACYYKCEHDTFLIVLVVALTVYTVVTVVEAHYSGGNRAKWGRQDMGED